MSTPHQAPIEIGSIRLEPLSLDHLDGIMTWVNDPEVTFYFAGLGKQAITREAEAAYVERLLASPTDRVFSIVGDTGYLGQIGLSKIYWPARNGRLGIMLPRYAQGRGVGKVAAYLLLQRAFGQLNMHKVWVIIRSDNPKGCRFGRSWGFGAKASCATSTMSAIVSTTWFAWRRPRPTLPPEPPQPNCERRRFRHGSAVGASA